MPSADIVPPTALVNTPAVMNNLAFADSGPYAVVVSWIVPLFVKVLETVSVAVAPVVPSP